MVEIKTREARKEDCEAILKLKVELAQHQNMNDGRPMLSCQELMRDGFDISPPYFKCLIAEAFEKPDSEPEAVGYALYFYAYAAFEGTLKPGKSMHLEDLVTSKLYRGRGIGSKLMKALAQICLNEDLARITLEVLDWNKSGINFYEKHHGYNSTKADNWVMYLFDKEALRNLAKS